MKLVNIFAAASILTLAAVGCTTTSSGTGGYGGSAGTGTGGSAGTGTGGSSGSGTGGSSGSGTGGSGTGGTGATGGSGGGTCNGQTSDCNSVSFDQGTDGGAGPCTTCAQSKCCNEINTCFQDPACAGLEACVAQNCANASDVNTCAQQSCSQCLTQAAVNAHNGFAQCLTKNCATECGIAADGGI